MLRNQVITLKIGKVVEKNWALSMLFLDVPSDHQNIGKGKILFLEESISANKSRSYNI